MTKCIGSVDMTDDAGNTASAATSFALIPPRTLRTIRSLRSQDDVINDAESGNHPRHCLVWTRTPLSRSH